MFPTRGQLVGASLVLLFLGGSLCSVLAQSRGLGFFQEIEAAPPLYLARKGKIWSDRSRVVGVLLYPPPVFTLSFSRAGAKEPLRIEAHSGALAVYECGWLPPGRYDLVVRATGFIDQKIPDVALKAGTDCLIKLFFNPKQYRRSRG